MAAIVVRSVSPTRPFHWMRVRVAISSLVVGSAWLMASASSYFRRVAVRWRDRFWLLAGAFSGFLVVAPVLATGLYAQPCAERGEPADMALRTWTLGVNRRSDPAATVGVWCASVCCSRSPALAGCSPRRRSSRSFHRYPSQRPKTSCAMSCWHRITSCSGPGSPWVGPCRAGVCLQRHLNAAPARPPRQRP